MNLGAGASGRQPSMRICLRHRLVVALFDVLASSFLAFAQGGSASPSGAVAGRVSDQSGGVLPDVVVTLTGTANRGRPSREDEPGRPLLSQLVTRQVEPASGRFCKPLDERSAG
jgi:hypothetical protein